MEKCNYRVEGDRNCAVHFAYSKYLDNAGFAYNGHVLGEAEYAV